MADRVGQKFGDYRLTEYLGGGGFADVYRGEHIYLSTAEHPVNVAVKVLRGDFTEAEIAQFRKEAQTIARLEHPHIIRIITFSVATINGQDIPFLVMPHAPHGSLDKRHPQGTQLPLTIITSYVKQIAEALQYAHDHKIVHRDIKPANFLLGNNGEILLSDFGIAVIAQSSHVQNPQDVAGTITYMAPEQLQGKPRAASDQYALGIVVYKWLSGMLPFKGSYGEVASQHVLVSPPPLHEKIPTIPPSVEQVVMKALAKDPHQRFVNVQEFATALEQANKEDNIITQPSKQKFESEEAINLIQPKPIPLSPTQEPAANKHSLIMVNNDPYQQSLPTQMQFGPAKSTPLKIRQPPAQIRQKSASSRSRTVPPPTIRRPAARPRNDRGIAFILTTIILILLVLGILLILIPSADIMITLPSQSFTTPVKVTANSTSRQDATLHTVPAQQLIFTGKVGPLTGTTQIGGQATGDVAFTNTGAQSLTIPTNTVVATNFGVQFLTQAETVVPPGSTFLAAPIIAQNAGTIGNVAANTITVIPGNSINAIANASGIPPASVSLTVTNASPTTGGKAGSTSNSTTTSMNTLKQMLHQQMQNQFKTWLKRQLHGQDQAGRATPDILGSPNPLPEESFTIGTPNADGTFTGTETVQATLLVVRTADLQAAAAPELNAALAASTTYRGDLLISPSSLTVSNIKSTISKDDKTLSISFTASGLIGQPVQLDTLRSLLAGRKVADAQSFLTNSASSGLQGVVNPQITLFPSFFSNIPFWTARITTHVQYHCTGKNCPKG